MAKKTFYFHGYLKKHLPDPVEIDCKSVSEGLRGITSQVRALKATKPVVKVVGFSDAEALELETDQQEIHVVPDLSGGKSGGFFKIVVGAVLVVVGVITQQYWLAAMGVSFALGGVMELMSPSPKIDLSGTEGAADPESSKYLGANKNTVKIGTRIPFLYGETLAHGHFISFNVDTKEIQTG